MSTPSRPANGYSDSCTAENLHSLGYPDGIIGYSWGALDSAIYLSTLRNPNSRKRDDQEVTTFWTVYRLLGCSRMVVCTLHRVFSSFQLIEDKSEILFASEQYRDCVKSLIEKNAPSADEMSNIDVELSEYEVSEMIWQLAEIFFFKKDMLHVGLLDWVRTHFSYRIDKKNQDLLSSSSDPEFLNFYWPSVYQFAIRGMLKEVVDMLHLHSWFSDPEHRRIIAQVVDLIKESPITKGSMGSKTFEAQQKFWWEKVLNMRNEVSNPSYGGPVGINVLLSIFSGDIIVIKQYCSDWILLLMALVFYVRPMVQRDEISTLVEQAIQMKRDLHGIHTPVAMLTSEIDSIVQDICGQNLEGVVHDVSRLSGMPWFKVHFLNLLYLTPYWSELHIDNRIHENAILEYSHFLWNIRAPLYIIADYLTYHPVKGKFYLSLFIKKSQIRSEKDAAHLLKLCKDYEIEEIYGTRMYIRKVVVQSRIKMNNLASALNWTAEKSHALQLTNKLLEELVVPLRAVFGTDHLVKVAMALNSMNKSDGVFLRNYKRLLKAYFNKKWSLTGDLLFKLITISDTPKWVRLTLLGDFIHVAQISGDSKIILPTNAIFELMKHLQEILMHHDKDVTLSPFEKLCLKFPAKKYTNTKMSQIVQREAQDLYVFFTKYLASSIVQNDKSHRM